MFKFSPGEYRTRDGARAVVVSEIPETRQLVGYYFHAGDFYPFIWRNDGSRWDDFESSLDLMPLVPPKHTIWLNIYSAVCRGHPTREKADEAADENRIACIRLEYTEGEGL